MTAPSPIPIKNARMFPLPEWYLPKGTINALDDQLEGASGSCERWGMGFAGLVVISVIAELIIAWAQPPYLLFLTESAITDAAVAIGIAGEVLLGTIWNNRIQTELRKRSNASLAAAVKVAGIANERAAKADLARAELEDQLRPRQLNQAQWDFIQGLAGRFEQINIGYETDSETWWYASEVQKAFFVAGIKVGMYRRAADVHSFGTLVYEPHGFEGSRPRTVEPLVEIFRKGDIPPARVSLAVITSLPTDIVAPSEIPMIILGGRFLVAPIAAADPINTKQATPQ
jgi:hypothetical protein